MILHEVRITDHVVVRYLERVLGVDVEKVKDLINEYCGAAAAVGATSFRKDGLRFEMERGTIVTVKLDHGGAAPGKRSREVTQQKMQGRGK